MPPKRLLQRGKCSFCNRATNEESNTEYGEAVNGKSFTAHYFCLLFSSGLNQDGDPDQEELRGFAEADVQQELKRGKRLTCCYCKMRGATIGCCRRSCSKTFHLPCGINKKCLFQYFDEFGAWCPDHRPCQNIVPLQTSPAICLICTNHLDPEPSHEVLLMPCCRRSLHRDCLQKQALSAGSHFFKCCHCANKVQFQKEMLVCGIYIPEQDASWEREPNAYEELLYQYKQCDATRCSCPQGRQYSQEDDPEWAVIRCYACGAHGIHLGCGNLRKDSSGSHQWMCPDCRVICAPRQLRQRPIPTTVPATKVMEERVVPELRCSTIGKEDIACKRRRPSNAAPRRDESSKSGRSNVACQELLPEKKKCDEQSCLSQREDEARPCCSRTQIKRQEKQTLRSRPRGCDVQGTSLAGPSHCEALVAQPKRNWEVLSPNTSRPNGHTTRSRRLHRQALSADADRASASASKAPDLLKENNPNCTLLDMHFSPTVESLSGSAPETTTKCSPMKAQLQHTLNGNIFTELERATSGSAPSKKGQKRASQSKRSQPSTSTNSWIQLSIVNFVRQLSQINR